MASKYFLITLAIVFPALISAEDFTVGDQKGWTINFDYQAWAQDKDFRVGDKLGMLHYYDDIMYSSIRLELINVFKVNGTGFQNCIKPALSEALTTGNDTIVLATPGRKWYICGVSQHCASAGQKLFIVVNPATMSPSGAPSRNFGAPEQAATGSANGIVHASFQSILSVAVTIFFALVV